MEAGRVEFPVLPSRVQIPPPDPQAVARGCTPQACLAAPVRCLLVLAGSGFGKTQWVADWAREQQPRPAWFNPGHQEDDAHALLVGLRGAWKKAHECDTTALDARLRAGFPPERWGASADALGCLWEGAGACWVIDGAHALEGQAAALLCYLMTYSSADTRWILVGRPPLAVKLPAGWRERGWVQEVGAEQLRLSDDDLRAAGLDPAALASADGWPLAVDALRRAPGGVHSPEESPLERAWESTPAARQATLLACALRERFTLDEAALLCPDQPVAEQLAAAAREGLFLRCLEDGSYTVTSPARDFLRDRVRSSGGLAALAGRTAPVALHEGDLDGALDYLLQAQDEAAAAATLERVAPAWLAQGSLARLIAYTERLAPGARGATLRLCYAEALARSHQFERALHEFNALASLGGALRGMALLGAGKVLVDTLQPVAAGRMLRDAYRQLPAAHRPGVLRLLAENSLNQGDTRRAQRYRQLAGSEAPGEDQDRLEARIHLRSGQLDLARQALLQAPEGVGGGHRNETLLLAYLAALQGDWNSAELLARSALRQARAQGAAFEESVAWMRLGHALQLKPGADAAEIRNCYSRARTLTEQMGAPRLQAEALMGEALFCAHGGEWARSYDAALAGLDLTRGAGDEWLTAWLQLTCAVAARLGGHPGTDAFAQAAAAQMAAVGDEFGSFLAGYWAAPVPFTDSPAEWAWIFQRPTLFGPRGKSEAQSTEPPPPLQASLRICLLGPIQVWRHGVEVPHKLWKRKKARELLAILLAARGGFVAREQLWERLFPDSSPQAAARDLRVLLHALFEVLDPDRPHNAPARCIVRRDDHYALPPGLEHGLELDLTDFERFVELGNAAAAPEEACAHWQRALDLTRGDYLQEYPYADWASAPRESWKQSYLDTAGRLADALARADQWERVSEVAHLMLQRDRCWEEAYRLLMQVHLRAGRSAQAARVYDQCRQALADELAVEPSEATEELYAQALGP